MLRVCVCVWGGGGGGCVPQIFGGDFTPSEIDSEIISVSSLQAPAAFLSLLYCSFSDMLYELSP